MTAENKQDDISKDNTTQNFDFGGQEFDNLLAGNQNVNFTVNYFDKSERYGKKHASINKARTLPFPGCRSDITFLELELLDQRRLFYRKHRWIAIETNNENFALIHEAIATLIAFDNDHQYMVQQVSISCEDYIRHGEAFTNSEPSICKLKIANSYELRTFFETPDNAVKLTESLEKSNNILLLVVESNDETQKLKKLISLANAESPIAYWVPSVKIQTQAGLKEIFQLNWLEKTLITISSWFNGLPYKVLHQIVLNLLQTKYHAVLQDGSAKGKIEQDVDTEEVEASDDVKSQDKNQQQPKTQAEYYADWLAQWKDAPDELLYSLGLINIADPNGEEYGIRFEKPELSLKYRAKTQAHLSFNMLEILNPVIEYTFGLSNSDAVYASTFTDLANFLTQLHHTRLINLDTEYLMIMFERCRYINTNAFNAIYRFIDLLAMLYQHPDGKKAVTQLLEVLTKQIIEEQRVLMNQVEFNVQVLTNLPKQMAELAKQAAEENIANLWYELKDKLYATLKILSAIGIDETACMALCEYLFKENYGIAKANVSVLPCTNILRLQLLINLRKTSKDFCSIALNPDFLNEEEITHFPNLSKTLRIVADEQITGVLNVSANSLNYLYEILLHKDGAKVLAWLLFNKVDANLAMAERTLEAIAQFQVVVSNMQQDTADETNADVAIDYVNLEISLINFLHLAATYSSREYNRHLNKHCRFLLNQTRERRNANSDNRAGRKILKTEIKALAFVKRHFSTKTTKNGDC